MTNQIFPELPSRNYTSPTTAKIAAAKVCEAVAAPPQWLIACATNKVGHLRYFPVFVRTESQVLINLARQGYAVFA